LTTFTERRIEPLLVAGFQLPVNNERLTGKVKRLSEKVLMALIGNLVRRQASLVLQKTRDK
jgi:hypothetical protein